MKKNKLINVLLALIALVFCFYIYKFVDGFLHDGLTLYKKPISEHQKLFTAKAQKLLHFIGGYKEKHGQPTSNFIYDNKYVISIFKCITNKNEGLGSQIKLSKNVSSSLNGFYSTGGNDELEIKYKKDRKDVSSFLAIGYNGELIKSELEGKLYHGFFKVSSYSLSYDSNRVFLLATSEVNDSPVSIVVVQGSNCFYIINMTTLYDRSEIPQELLYDLVAK